MSKAKIICSILLILTMISCDTADYDRIPAAPVRIEFGNAAMWNIYGVSAYPDSRTFILNEGKPKGFPYTANSYTGYGGVMLVCDPVNMIHAYDLACPVERSSRVRIEFDQEELVLRCNECGSTYDVTTGVPLSGRALDHKYLLQSYAVYFNAMGGVLVTR